VDRNGLTPYFMRRDDGFVPNEIAHGGWGPTLGGHVVGGLLARAIERHVDDAELQPARLTVEILRRVASAPVRVSASVVRSGSRMKALDAEMTQQGEVVARASALYLRRGVQPGGRFWSTPVDLPPIPREPDRFDDTVPMFITPYGAPPGSIDSPFPWQYDGPRYAWLREVRDLVDGEELTPLLRAALAVDVTSPLTNFSTDGLAFINADYTLTLSRLPRGLYIGMAALVHASAEGVATGTAALFDQDGPIGTGVSTAVANFNFTPNVEVDKVTGESRI